MLPLYQPYALFTTLLFPPLVLLRRTVVWKDRRVSNEKAPR
jgi:hypothetical protein